MELKLLSLLPHCWAFRLRCTCSLKDPGGKRCSPFKPSFLQLLWFEPRVCVWVRWGRGRGNGWHGIGTLRCLILGIQFPQVTLMVLLPHWYHLPVIWVEDRLLSEALFLTTYINHPCSSHQGEPTLWYSAHCLLVYLLSPYPDPHPVEWQAPESTALSDLFSVDAPGWGTEGVICWVFVDASGC